MLDGKVKQYGLSRTVCFGALISGLMLAMATPLFAQKITLRDFTELDVAVESFDVDGVKLVDGQTLRWWEIHEAEIEESKQQEFNQFISEFGLPSLRIKRRVANQDFSGLYEIGRALYSRCGDEPTNMARFAAGAWFRGAVAEGEREDACQALLRFLWIEGELHAREFRLWNDANLVKRAEQEIVVEGLLPVWFDPEAAKTSWKQITNDRPDLGDSDSLSQMVYTASLAIAAGDHLTARKLCDDSAIQQSPWLKFLQSQQLLAKGEFAAVVETIPEDIAQFSVPLQCLFLYHKGVAGLRSPDKVSQQTALLDLLQIPANYGDQFPELAAACLYHAIESDMLQENLMARHSLGNELERKFPATHFGNVWQQSRNSMSKNDEN